MADNQTLYPGDTGTAFTAAADEIASVKYPRVKITWGVDGTATDASASNPLPVTFSSGTVTADTELPAAAALADNTSTPTAPAVGAFTMFYDGSTWDRVRGDSTDGVLVNLGSNNDVTFGGTVTCDTELPTAAALADNTANPTTTSVGALQMVYDGSTWDRQRGDSTDGTLVNLGSNNDVTVTSGAITPAGNVAHDAVDSGNPVKVGAVYKNTPGAVADGDRTDLTTDNRGNLKALLMSNNGTTPVTVQGITADDAATGTVLYTGSQGLLYDGATWDRQPGNSVDGTLVNLGANNDVTVTSGTITIGTSVTPGTAATNLGKAEDAGHTTGDVGVQMLAVRNDSGSILTTTDLDYSPVSVNSSGQLHVGFVAPGNAAASLGKQEDLPHTTGDTGVFVLGVRSDTPAAAAADGDYHAQLTSGRGAQWTTQTPSTQGGLSINRVISAATTNATSVKASAGQVYGWYITNVNAAARYVKFYNKASAPTVGTDTPVMTLAIPANGGTNVEFTNGVAFATGIALAITTGATDADTGAVAANEIIVNTVYA